LVAVSLATSAKSESIRIVAFGTSLTAGQLWPAELQKSLSICLNQKVSVSIVAKNGATSAWGRVNVSRVISEHPDVILIEFAVNDSSAQRLMSKFASALNMEVILTSIRRELPNARIFIMKMNPSRGIRGALRFRRPAFEAAHEKLAAAMNVQYIDLSGYWRLIPPDVLKKYIPDGLHPLPSVSAGMIVAPLTDAVAGRRCGA